MATIEEARVALKIAKNVQREINQILQPCPLSKRELEVLFCIAAGFENSVIGLLLDISEQTVKNHITHILKKLEILNRTRAVVLALQHGWIQFPQEITNDQC